MSGVSSPVTKVKSNSGVSNIWTGLLGGSAVIGIGLSIELVCQFARTLLLAHILDPTQFGLVVSINALATIIEMTTWIGLDRYLVYAPEGDSQHALDVSHALTWIRSILSGFVIFAISIPTADLIGAGEDWISFALVATTPILRGGTHLGVIQMQRSGCFWPGAVSEAGAMLLGLIAAVVSAAITLDHRAIVVGLVAQALGNVVLSHLLAFGCRYRLGFDVGEMGKALQFGLPLMGNGFALAVVSQADRLLVSGWLGFAAAGLYSVSLTLIVQPVSLVQRLVTTLLQPHLSRNWHTDRDGSFQASVRILGLSSALLGMAGAAVTICLGAPVVILVFGSKYAAPDVFFLLLGGLVLCRFSRGAVHLVGLSIGRTSDLMLANLAALTALPTTLVAFWIRPDATAAIWGLVAGELTSLLVVEGRLRRLVRDMPQTVLSPLVKCSVPTLLLGLWTMTATPSLWWRAVAGVAVALGGLVAAVRLIREAHAQDSAQKNCAS